MVKRAVNGYMDKKGNVSMELNTAGMYRAFIGNDGELTVKIYSN